MITEYHRPNTLSKALELLSRNDVSTIPIGGGSVISQLPSKHVAVVDLQLLDLDHLDVKGKNVKIGATVTLQKLHSYNIHPTLKTVIGLEATYNIRQVGTIAGALVSTDGRSPFVTTMLAMDAELHFQPGDEKINLGNYLPLREEWNTNQLITHVIIPNEIDLAYKYVARTPADIPIVCVAVGRWPSGRMRVALGGYGSEPYLVIDGQGIDGVESAIQDAYREAGDQWSSAEYRSEMATILFKRCLQSLS